MGYFALALFLLGIIFIIIAPINKKKNARCSAKTQGTLEGTQARYNSKGSLPDMNFYSYLVDGVEYQIKSTVRSSEANGIGDSCTIWYDPNNPEDAQPFHYESPKVYKIILIIGIVMVLIGFVLFIYASAH